jgi:peptide/nickel transport system permease protein
MLSYLLRRLFFFFITLLFTSMLIFTITRLLPGDIPSVILGREAASTAKENLRRELGLDLPIPEQYGNWLAKFVQGDWGNSYSLKTPLRPVVMQRLGNSLRLALVALLFSVPPAIALGVVAGLNENRWPDTVISLVTLVLVGLPEFVTAIILINFLALRLKWFPAVSTVDPDATFLEALPSLIMPAITAATVLLAYIARLTRVGVVTEMKKNYVRTATLKGLPYRTIVGKHVLRNALLPTITVIAISLGWLIGGLVVIENVFSYPGLGRLLTYAITGRDLPLIQAITMITVTVYILTNLAADLLYSYLNPRIRLA